VIASAARVVLTVLTLVVLLGWNAQAQDYPNRIIRVVVGPGPDIVARLFGAKITELLRQPVVVEPRPGAGGTIASQTVASSPPDGYTLLLASASYTINTALQQSPFNLGRDFAPVGLVVTTPFVLVVHPSVPARTVGELIAYAKANPGKLNYASSGIGTPPHFAAELFKSMAGVDIVHLPYRDANLGLNAVVAGTAEMMFSIASVAQSQIAGGTVRGLAVTSREPSPLVPGLPSIAQAELPGFEVIGWNGFVARAARRQPSSPRSRPRCRPGSTTASCARSSPPPATTPRAAIRRSSSASSSARIPRSGSTWSRAQTSRATDAAVRKVTSPSHFPCA
jgi:tripartite-type tricarboxylate transporter receptor subunit TctC